MVICSHDKLSLFHKVYVLFSFAMLVFLGYYRHFLNVLEYSSKFFHIFISLLFLCIFLLDASSYSSFSLSYSISLSVTLLQILSVLGLSGLSIYSFHLSGKSSLESIMIISLGPEASKKIYF